MKGKTTEKIKNRLRTTAKRLFDPRNIFYWAIVGGGIFTSAYVESQFLTGLAFITAGLVGLVMSVITGEVAENLSKEIKNEGKKTRDEIKKVHTEIAGHTIILGSILTTMKSMEKTLGEIRDK